MSHALVGKPDGSEYPAHFNGYVALVPEDDVLAVLEFQHQRTIALLRGIDEARGNFRYDPAKWSIKELIGHVIDAERAFSFRAFHFGRGHKTPLPSFEQDFVAKVAPYLTMTVRDVADDYDAVRCGTLQLFRHFDSVAWVRRGIVNSSEVSVRAMAYVIAGHERHHLNIVKTRYLPTP
jgi:hypothetical protein